jgi:hypothetical protein
MTIGEHQSRMRASLLFSGTFDVHFECAATTGYCNQVRKWTRASTCKNHSE